MALFSIVCLLANSLNKCQTIVPNHTAWYKKKGVTFSDVLAAVRLEIFQKARLLISHENRLIDSYSDNVRTLWFLLTQAVA